MNILISIAHPAHVHLFKNTIWMLEEKGHDIKIIARDKDVCRHLLDSYGFDYELISNAGFGMWGLATEFVNRAIKLFPIFLNFNPDIIVALMDPSIGINSRIFRKKYISFSDTEHATLLEKLVLPLTDTVVTPSCFKKEFGTKQIRYAGYHELAYLHPNRFTPNPEILEEIGLNENDSFIIMRFVSWGAHHDYGHNTLTLNDKLNAVNEFKKYGRVLITSEHELPPELEEYRITVSPEKIHHLLYYATLLYGDSATMASECAVLGTHSIFCDYAGRGYTDEEEKNYNLVYNFYDEMTMGKESLDKAIELLKNPDLRKEGKTKRQKLLGDKIDVSEFMVWFVKNYPESADQFKARPAFV